MSYRAVRAFDTNLRFLGALRLSDGVFIPKRAAGLDASYDAFIAWNEAQSPPLSLADGLPDLNTLKEYKISRLGIEVRGYVETRYPVHKQRTLTHIAATGNQAQKNYVQPAWDWIHSVLSYYYEKEDALIAAADNEAVYEIVWEPGLEFTASDPLVTIREALSLSSSSSSSS